MRLAALLLTLGALTACGSPAPTESEANRQVSAPLVLTLRAQACARPQPRDGAAVVVAPDVAATAAHLVEGKLRTLEVGGLPARVAAIDTDADLAVLALVPPREGSLRATLRSPEPGPATVLTPFAPAAAEIVDVVTLRVDNRGDARIDERRSAKLDIDVQPGDSGSALIDERGRLVGIITLRRPAAGVSYATSAEELDALLTTAATIEDLAPAEPCV